ncbi:MAG: polysaccharide biosynthesis/export family protein [Burkholderiaceae bacterium]|nr:polysaccharide biosynthesis/export family protein [Burkholderiaceae bacterium]
MTFVAVLGTGRPAHAQAGPSAAETPAAFHLGPGDVLSVTVWKQPALSLQLPVAPDGTLRYPLAGPLDVVGRTLAEVETVLSAKLGEQLRGALVTVSLVQVHSYRVYVLGEVLRPGELILRGPVSVVQALAMSNGFTPFAKRDKVLVVRRRGGAETRETFDYSAYVRGDGPSLAELAPGDIVIVQ